MAPFVDGKTYFAAPPTERPSNLILFALLIIAGVAFLSTLVNAQQSISNSDLTFDSMYKLGKPLPPANSDMSSPDPSELRLDRVGGDTSSGDCPNAVYDCGNELPLAPGAQPGQDSQSPASQMRSRAPKPDFNRDIYYRNKLEFALDVGWLPINIPFPFDILEGDPYDLYPLRYTLVPILASLRWQVDAVGSPWILRGNWDVTATLSITAIPRGAETHYFSYDMGIRRNFVQRNWRVVPYVDIRAGLGLIDAKGPLGVYYAQGQNYTFTMNMGSGVRYNFNSRYAISAGLNWMHISNNNLSAPEYSNYGINVYGPLFGLDIQLRRRHRRSDQHD